MSGGITMKVQFYEEVSDELLKFAVIIAKADGKWVFCKHKDRSTYEVPGGHREKGEAILDTAKRELYEESGAIDFELKPICVYSVIGKTRDGEDLREETFGMLYYAEIHEFEKQLHYEIKEVLLSESLVTEWTYPLIQPRLIEKVIQILPTMK